MFKNYYDILGVTPKATATELKSAYRSLARKYHPDSGTEGGSDAMFNEVTEAYHVLSDSEQRARYDRRHGFDAWKPADDEPEQRATAAGYGTAFEQTAEERRAEPETDPRSEADGFYNSGGRASAQVSPEDIGSQGFAGPAGHRFDYRGRGGSFLDRMRELFGGEEPPREEPLRTAASSRPKAKPRKAASGARKSVEEALRGEREFTFTVTASESLSPSYREIAVKDGANPRTIRVKIPAGVCDGAVLKVKIGDGEFVRVHVRIQPDELLEREGYDIVLKLPVTVGEAIRGGEIEVPTPLGPVTVRLPSLAKDRKRLRLKGRGAPKPGPSGARGDLFVKPYVVAPDLVNETVNHAAQAIDEHYLSPVRDKIPKKL